MSTEDRREPMEVAEGLVSAAVTAGADVAEASCRVAWELSAKVRLGKPELVEEAGHRSAALRVMRNQRVATAATSDLSERGLDRLVADAMDLVVLTEPDEHAGPADPDLLAEEPHPDLDLDDPAVARVDALGAIGIAIDAERAALELDDRLRLSEGATFSRTSGEAVLVLSSGFVGRQRGSYASLVVSPVVEDAGGKKRRGYHWTASRHLSDLESPAAVGETAARNTLEKLGARKVETCEAPVVFDAEVARSVLGTFGSCVLGGAAWRKATYLLERRGTEVASDLVTIVDDPLIRRGPGSRPFDGEGLRSRTQPVVERGILRTFLLDSYSARKLGSESTASANRSSGWISPATSNFVLQPGDTDREALLASTERGLYVTEMMGFGFNPVTGNFSRGASGFWIRNGRLSHPVSEVTISGNLDDMMRSIDAVADDLVLKAATASPTFRVAAMTIAGT